LLDRLIGGSIDAMGAAGEGFVRLGRWYLKVLAWTAVCCLLLLGGSVLLLLAGVLLKSGYVLSLSPLLTTVAMVAAIGVLAPVVALARLLPDALTEAGKTSLRAMGAAAVAGLLGAMVVRVLPFAEHPHLLAVFLALVAVVFLSALVSGREIVVPFASTARRLALRGLSFLLLYLLVVKLVPEEVRDRLWESLSTRVRDRLVSSTPQRVPYTGLASYSAIPKFRELDGKQESLVSFCEQEGRPGPERFVLADRKGTDPYIGCRLEALTPEVHRRIERHLQEWEAGQALRRGAAMSSPAAPNPPQAAPPLQSASAGVLQEVTHEDFLFRLHGCRRAEDGVTCTVTARNWGSQDRYLGVSPDRGIQRNQNYSRLIALDGTEYAMKTAKLGSLAGQDVWGMYGLRVDAGRSAGLLIHFPTVPPGVDRFDRLVVALGANTFQDTLEEHVDFTRVCVECLDRSVVPAAPLSVTETQIGRAVTADDLVFTLERCQRLGEGLRCEFTALNTSDDDVSLEIRVRGYGDGPASSSLMAGDGTEYEVAEAQIGSNRLTSRFCESALPSGVKLRGTFRVDGLPTSVADAQQVRLRYAYSARRPKAFGSRRSQGHAVFRDIALLTP
jgi:hypothetical protein